MIAFSKGETKQLLRGIIPLSEGRLFGVMPGAMGANGPFGAKLISVFHDNFAKGIQSHQGLVILFDPDTGAPVCVVHAGEITAIRTAAASAVATDALARNDARLLSADIQHEKRGQEGSGVRMPAQHVAVERDWLRRAFAAKSAQGEVGIGDLAGLEVEDGFGNAIDEESMLIDGRKNPDRDAPALRWRWFRSP